MGKLDQLWEAGKELAKKGREAGKDAKEKAKEASELVKLQDHFKTLSETRQYLKDHRDELKSSVGFTSVFDDEAELGQAEARIRIADEMIRKALDSVLAIGKTPLRFSVSYLDSDIQEINGLIDEYTGYSVSFLKGVGSLDGNVGRVASFVMGDSKKTKIGQLSATAKGFGVNAELLKKSLGQLQVDHLTTPSNNSLLNHYLGIQDAVRGAQETYDTLKNVYEAIGTIKKVTRFVF